MPEPTENPLLARANESLPHVYTFASLFNLATRSYNWRWSEAYKNSRDIALSMRRDAFLISLLWERMYPTIMMGWSIEPEDPQVEEQKKVADKYTKAIKRIPRFRRYLKSAMEALWYGRAGLQQQWKKVKVGGEDVWTIGKHSPVNGDKIQYSWDHIPRILIYAGARSELEAQGANVVLTDRYPALQLDTPYWRDRFLIHAHDVVDADFFDAEMAGTVHGVGLRDHAYWLDWVKKEISTWMMDYMERVGLGFTIFYYEEGNPQSRADADKAANAYGRNTRIVWPRSTSGDKVGPGIERIETDTSAAQFIVGLMQYFDDKIQRLFIGRSADLSSSDSRPLFGAGQGAAELAKTQQSQIISYDCDNLAETLDTDLLDPMIRFNDTELDFTLRFKFAVEDTNPEAKLKAARLMYDMGLPLRASEIYAWGGATKPSTEEIEEAMEQQEVLADEQQQQQQEHELALASAKHTSSGDSG